MDPNYFANLAFAYLPLLFVAVLVWWLLLRWLDWLAGGNFKSNVAPIIRRDALASGVYYGARLIAGALLVSAVFGAVRF
jgi:hypothetical protein